MGVNSSKKLLLLQATIVIFGLLLISKPSFGQSLRNPQVMQSGFDDDSPVARPKQKVDRLLQLMQQRLILQHYVARWKWNQRSPIEAPQREKELLAQLQQQAMAYSLEPNVVSAFFQSQIDAGKLIQITDFQNWVQEGVQSFHNVPSLNLTIRPLLDQLSSEFLSVLAALTPVLDSPKVKELIQSRCQTILQGDGIDTTVRRVALAPLLELKGTSRQNVSSGSNIRREKTKMLLASSISSAEQGA